MTSESEWLNSENAYRSERGQERRARLITSRKPQCLMAAPVPKDLRNPNMNSVALGHTFIQKVCRKRPSGIIKP